MQSFQLYDELEQTPVKPTDSLIKLSGATSYLNQEQADILCALIIHYHFKTNPSNATISVTSIEKTYGLKKASSGGRGLIVPINNLPEKLTNIIIAYLNKLTT